MTKLLRRLTSSRNSSERSMPFQSTIASLLLRRIQEGPYARVETAKPRIDQRSVWRDERSRHHDRRLAVALGVALLDLALELLHDVGVAQRGDVAELAALGDVAQQPAHDLARAGLGQVVGPDDALGPGELADPLGDVLTQLGDHLVVALLGARERHER